MKRPLRTQRRIPGQHRTRMSTAVSKEIERRLRDEMRLWGVSRSFVIANALAYTFKIKLDAADDYHNDGTLRLVRKRA